MTLPSLVSFSGNRQAGKDAAADLLVSRVRFDKTYMLKPIEQVMLKVNPLIVDHKEGTIERFADLHENLGFDATRNFEEADRLMRLGTEAGRDILGKNIWIDIVFDEVKALRAQDRNVVISGVGYSDELALVRELGGVCVWINRRGAKQKAGVIRAEDCDLVIENSGTLRDLYVTVISSLEEYNTNKENDNVG